ncbi:MAG: hypothetical protein HYV28_15225 [Ignavibacteriales bacterium]|nr:hypothetical protein [Ignavibacteriales bacterium]
MAPAVNAQGSTEFLWVNVNEASILENSNRQIIPRSYRTLQLDVNELESVLSRAPMEFTARAQWERIVVSLPLPDGSFSRFTIVNSPIMESELAAKYPDIKTYSGQGIDDPAASVRFDITPAGFHAMIRSTNGTVFIDPYSKGNTRNYICYYKKDFVGDKQKREFVCLTAPDRQVELEIAELIKHLPKTSGTQLRTYRLAVAATGEYTAFHGGTVANALAAIVTTMNRVNGIYESEVAIRMVLIGNTNTIIYTNSATDPYTNGTPGTMINQNQTNINSVIGSANYDIGHVFGTNSGGLAGVGVVCYSTAKARGVTGSSAPVGDPFDVDYVAHEMGHQFSAHHTFNGTTGSCGGSNRSADNAYEPGSGTTIMGYAGICGAQDIQPNSDAYFHLASILQIVAYSTIGYGNTCPVTTNTGNNPPVVEAGPGEFTIPYNTPFWLNGSATDPNADALTYCWEEYDLGAAGAPNSPSGNAPIFRSFSPMVATSRTFPKIADIVNNTQVMGEILPSYSRTMKFKLTARDNRAGGGGIGWDSMYFNVVNTAGPFLVTAPNTAISVAGNTTQSIIWDVANTNTSPVNCSTVNILLSTDGGYTFPTVLAANTPNDGTENVIIPNIATTQARIRIESVGNYFFDISNTNFTIVMENLVPSVISSSSSSTTAGGTDFSLTVFGSNFVEGSVVRWNGSDRATTYISNTEVDVTILSSDIASGGYATITVFNPSPGGGLSNGLSFTVNNPSPAIDSITPSSAAAGGWAFTLIVNGSNFVPGSVVRWNGSARSTSFINSTRIDAEILAADIAAGGTASVRVYNGVPGGGTSSALSFTINNPSPSLISLSPSSIIAGGDAFTLTVYGTDFVPGSVARVNGENRTTTYVNSTQLDVSILAGDRDSAATVVVTVSNPSPGGGISNELTLTVNNPEPSLASISPTNVIAGGDGFTMTLTGLYFLPASVVRINGSNRTTTYISSTQLEALITAGDRAVGGTANITVYNPSPGGGVSYGQTFTVNNPTPYISSISPTSVIAGGDGFTLTVNGSNLMVSSVVRINGSDRVTTYISKSQLEAAITASDRATGVAASITVNSPSPGGGTSNTETLNVNNPVPYISAINPSTVIAGGDSFTLTITGQYFVPGSIVRINGSDRTTTYTSSTEIQAAITADDRANGGTDTITVFNPSPAGGLSYEQILTINNPVPYISSISPSNVTAGGPGLALTVNGTYFVPGSIVRWNGSNRPTTFVSGSQLTAAISAEDIALSGIVLITVWNSTPGGGLSLESTCLIQQGPTIQASQILLTSLLASQLTIDWIDGSGEQRAVFVKRGSYDTAAPFNDTTYTANTIFGSGSGIGNTGWYCVFNGTTHPAGVTVTNLAEGRYTVMVCEYNGTAGSEIYNTSTAVINPANILIYTVMQHPGNTLDFDGTDDYVDCGNNTSVRITGTALTLEAWVKARSWETNVWEGSLVAKEGTDSGYMLRCGDNGKVDFSIGNGSAWQSATTASLLTTDRWYHLAAVYNGSTMKIFIDGEEAASQTATEPIVDHPNSLWIGSSALNPVRTFDGQIDEVRIWNTARSQVDIQNDMNLYLTGNESGLAAYFRFDQGTAGGENTGIDTLYDLTANANDGTLSNVSLSGNSSNWVTSNAIPPVTVNLKLFIEGIYNENLMGHVTADTIHAMLQEVNGLGVPSDSLQAVLSTTGTASLKFYNASAGTYYIIVKHRNSIETWSKTGGEALQKGVVTNYDFTINSSQAYAGNMMQKGGVWCIYSGDVNQDGIVDFTDLTLIDNDAYLFSTGYLATDLSGDQFIDFTDLTICDNNSYNFVQVIKPPVITKPSAKTVPQALKEQK